MASSVAETSTVRQPRLPGKADAMARLDPRKAGELETRRLLGRAVEGCRWHARLSLKEFAGLVHRDESVVRAWITAEEPPQIAAVIAVPVLKQPFLVAFAEELGAGADIETVIRVRRVAK